MAVILQWIINIFPVLLRVIYKRIQAWMMINAPQRSAESKLVGPLEVERSHHQSTTLGSELVTSPNNVVEVLLSELAGTIISLEELATPCRFRPPDCTAFLDLNILRITEHPDGTHLENVSFAAVSYPWRDLQMPPDMTPPEGSFSVKGAEHADQISIDVLRTVCVAARHFGASLLWLDRLCIMQCRKDDKSWQIQRMHQIYTCCNPCLVLPGGLVRLAKLSEPTTWIDRAWTLQEAIAPGRNKLKCLFSFTQTTYKAFIQEECADSFSPAFLNFMDHTPSPLQTIIEPERSAACDLLELFRLMAGGMAGFKCHEPSLSSRHDRFPVGIIHTPAAKLLQRVLKSRSSQHLWMSAYTRSSSRPADMVFSIMGIMGVNLEVSQFDVQDRTKATIKLIQELMKRGQSARWLYISPTMPTSREISTLPQMPETSESGRAFLRTGDEMTPAFEAIGEQEIWQSDGAPDGVMFDSGYFRFYGKAALVVQKSGTSSKSWGERALTRVYDDREVWAVVVGSRKELNRDPKTGKIRGTPAGAPPPLGITEITLMFIERHSYGLFHRVGMEREINEKNTTEWSWTYREFDVGGPGRGERVRFQIAPTGPVYM